MNPTPSTSIPASWNPLPRIARRIPVAMLLIGAAFFIHFLALGFASFPLQTHLRQLLNPSSASMVASVLPIAACLTYFIFRFAEARLWTRSPQRLLAVVAVLVACLQLLLGWRLHRIHSQDWILGPAIDVGVCLLLLGCAHSICMTLLNHIGVATMGPYAFTVRAAGSAGYMLAVVLMGMLWSEDDNVADVHLFIACSISLVHALVATSGIWLMGRSLESSDGHPRELHPGGLGGQKAALSGATPATATANKDMHLAAHGTSSSSPRSNLAWWGLLALVWMVAMCEMSYSLYAHEFLTGLYGNLGYFIFAGAIALEIALLLGMPWLPALRQRLLFVGPLGWLSLLMGCLLALGGLLPMGVMALALALNCPFQVSANEHAHRMTPSILGIASMTLAQSLGYMSATVTSALVSEAATGPKNLWLCMLPVAAIALGLSVWKIAITRRASINENLI